MMKKYLLASDFDQTLSFNDSGIALSELLEVLERGGAGKQLDSGMVVGLLMMTPATRGICVGGSIKMTDCWNRESGRSGVATRKISGATAPQQEKCTR
jgi:hypothetical protein